MAVFPFLWLCCFNGVSALNTTGRNTETRQLLWISCAAAMEKARELSPANNKSQRRKRPTSMEKPESGSCMSHLSPAPHALDICTLYALAEINTNRFRLHFTKRIFVALPAFCMKNWFENGRNNNWECSSLIEMATSGAECRFSDAGSQSLFDGCCACSTNWKLLQLERPQQSVYGEAYEGHKWLKNAQIDFPLLVRRFFACLCLISFADGSCHYSHISRTVFIRRCKTSKISLRRRSTERYKEWPQSKARRTGFP